jgi:uncharacterized protein (TIGR02001 family)
METIMNKRFAVLLGSSLLLGAMSASAAEISGNVTLGTDYVYRGISQTDEAATIQGGFDYTGDSGIYAGIWSSNVAFDGSIEIDYYFGYGGKINDDLGYDVGYIYYQYPNQPSGQPDSNFQEVNGNLSYQGFSAGFAYSNDFFGESGSGTYLQVGYDLSLPNDFGLGFHYGKTKVDDVNLDYSDYSIGLSKSLSDLDFSLTWYDTNLSQAECGGDICEGRVVLAIGKSL